jgi:hypothetical protein
MQSYQLELLTRAGGISRKRLRRSPRPLTLFAVASHRVNRRRCALRFARPISMESHHLKIDAERPAMGFIARRPGVGLRLQR